MKDSTDGSSAELGNRNNVPMIYIVEDDVPVRESLEFLFRSVGMHATSFENASDFLLFARPNAPSCLLLDVRMPKTSGLELQQELIAADVVLPIIFISGYGDVQMAVQAMKAGAQDFITKPFRGQDVLDAVARALRKEEEYLRNERILTGLRTCYLLLNAREREIFSQVVDGLMNKQIAVAMNLSEITIKTHRALAMRKMRCRTFAEFVRKGHVLGLGAELGSAIRRERDYAQSRSVARCGPQSTLPDECARNS
jgi:FixJ family two-component response regulator